MNCPGWLLRVIVGYLSDRQLVVRHKGCESHPQHLPGGTGQGTRLGMFLFIVLVTKTGFHPSELCYNVGELLTAKPTNRPVMNKVQAKFMDDIFLGSVVNLKSELEKTNSIQPAPLHLRTGHILNHSNPIYKAWEDLNDYVEKFQMKMNFVKTKIMIFNRSLLYDFLPQIYGEHGEPIEIVETTQLLGLVIRSDLRWHDNTEKICAKTYCRLWAIRQLKRYGASREDLVDVWVKQGRSLLEYAVPVWGGAITVREEEMIEACQKAALAVIMGEEYRSYDHSLSKTGLSSLKSRRALILNRFSLKTFKNDKYKTGSKR